MLPPVSQQFNSDGGGSAVPQAMQVCKIPLACFMLALLLCSGCLGWFTYLTRQLLLKASSSHSFRCRLQAVSGEWLT